MNAGWVTPTMAVSVYSGSRMMETLETSSHFAISLLNSDQRDISERLGASGQPLYGSLKGIDTFPAPQAGQPVGRVFVAVGRAADAGGELDEVRMFDLAGDRAGIHAQTVRHALDLVAQVLR